MKPELLETTALERVPPQKPPPFAAFAEALALETADELVFLRTGSRLDRRVFVSHPRNMGKTALADRLRSIECTFTPDDPALFLRWMRSL